VLHLIWDEKITTIKQIKQLVKKLPCLGIPDSSTLFYSGDKCVRIRIWKNFKTNKFKKFKRAHNKNILLLKKKSFLLFYV